MLKKFETKSDTVRGLSFHVERPWILVSFNNGVIQIWDYDTKALVDQFEDYDGPIRGVHFHNSQPLFVSGGDDQKIKVWNYRTRRCLFTLFGHCGSINTVQFHHELPWIISASNDHTIRLWNWLSRTCISVLTGHCSDVRSASFHPKEDLVISASLDRTVRVWDIGFLRKNYFVSHAKDVKKPKLDKIVNYSIHDVIGEHSEGAVCVAFHPTLPLILSGGFDMELVVWRMNDQKTWKARDLMLHEGNVSCVLFHPRQNAYSSASEDKSIIMYDATKPACLGKLCCKNDKFWILDSHPKKNLVAAGHDSGMFIYKLGRERPIFYVNSDTLYHIKDHFLCSYEYSTKKDTQMIPVIEPATCFIFKGRRTLAYSPLETAVLISSEGDDGISYELHVIHNDVIGMGGNNPHETKRGGGGGSAVFVNHNRFAVLFEKSSSNHVLVKNLKNETVDKVALPFAADAIFCGGGSGNLLFFCRAEGRVIVFNLQQRNIVGELRTKTRFIKYVVWAKDTEKVALLGKLFIIIANKKLMHLCTVRETNHVKSGAWDVDNGVFIYTTLKHIKYCLPNGETGIIKTLLDVQAKLYTTYVSGSTVYCLDREGNISTIVIDTTEYVFKLHLYKKNYDQVRSIIKSSSFKFCGQAIIEYLQQKGFSDLALDFIKDERSRFNLALEIGNIQVAVASAEDIDEKDCWLRLGVAALRQGYARITEYAYQRANNFERLAFLYLVTGKMDKYSKLLKTNIINNNDNNFMNAEFIKALCLGDVCERIQILENTGHRPLAYITAAVHGLIKTAERLAADLGDNDDNVVPLLPEGKCPSLLMASSPIMCTRGDWPLLKNRITAKRLSSASDNGEEEEEEATRKDKRDQGWDIVVDDVGETSCKGKTTVVVYRRKTGQPHIRDPGWEIVYDENVDDDDGETSRKRKTSVVVCRRKTRT